MRLEIKGLAELRERLARIRVDEILSQALAEEAQRIAQAVQDDLSAPPGEGDHASPWRQSGALHDSVGAQTDGLHAVIGSSDPAAAPQEMGTANLPARPFLAPAAARMGEEAAHAIGAKLAAALRDGPGSASPDPLNDVLSPSEDG